MQKPADADPCSCFCGVVVSQIAPDAMPAKDKPDSLLVVLSQSYLDKSAVKHTGIYYSGEFGRSKLT
jgi:hypothetical protein